MRKLEIILSILALIGIILQLSGIPGGAILLILSLTILAVLYYPFGFIVLNNIRVRKIFSAGSYRGLSALRILGTIGIGMALSTVCLGIVFKLETYPGAGYIQIIGLVSLIILAVPAVIRYTQTRDKHYWRLLLRTLIFGVTGIIIAFIPG